MAALERLPQGCASKRTLFAFSALCALVVSIALAIVYSGRGSTSSESPPATTSTNTTTADIVQLGLADNPIYGLSYASARATAPTGGAVPSATTDEQWPSKQQQVSSVWSTAGPIASLTEALVCYPSDGDELVRMMSVSSDCTVIILSNGSQQPYNIKETMVVSSRKLVVGNPIDPPVIQAEPIDLSSIDLSSISEAGLPDMVERIFDVTAGGYLEARFLAITLGDGRFDLTTRTHYLIGCHVRVQAGGAFLATGVLFIHPQQTPERFAAMLAFTAIGGRIRGFGAWVLVAGGTLRLQGCQFILFFPLGEPSYNVILVGGMVLVVAGNAVITGCYFLATSTYGISSGVGTVVGVVGGTLTVVGGGVLITCGAQAVFGSGKLLFVGGGVGVMIGFSLVATIPLYVRAGTAEVYVGGGVMIYIGLNSGIDLGCASLTMAGQVLGVGGGIATIIGGALYSTVNQVFAAGAGGLLFNGGGGITIVGLSMATAALCETQDMAGVLIYNGGGTVNIIGLRYQATSLAAAVAGAGSEVYCGGGWVNIINTKSLFRTGYYYENMAGSLVLVLAGGGTFINRRFNVATIREYRQNQYLYTIGGTKVPVYYALTDIEVKDKEIKLLKPFPFFIPAPCSPQAVPLGPLLGADSESIAQSKSPLGEGTPPPSLPLCIFPDASLGLDVPPCPPTANIPITQLLVTLKVGPQSLLSGAAASTSLPPLCHFSDNTIGLHVPVCVPGEALPLSLLVNANQASAQAGLPPLCLYPDGFTIGVIFPPCQAGEAIPLTVLLGPSPAHSTTSSLPPLCLFLDNSLGLIVPACQPGHAVPLSSLPGEGQAGAASGGEIPPLCLFPGDVPGLIVPPCQPGQAIPLASLPITDPGAISTTSLPPLCLLPDNSLALIAPPCQPGHAIPLALLGDAGQPTPAANITTFPSLCLLPDQSVGLVVPTCQQGWSIPLSQLPSGAPSGSAGSLFPLLCLFPDGASAGIMIPPCQEGHGIALRWLTGLIEADPGSGGARPLCVLPDGSAAVVAPPCRQAVALSVLLTFGGQPGPGTSGDLPLCAFPDGRPGVPIPPCPPVGAVPLSTLAGPVQAGIVPSLCLLPGDVVGVIIPPPTDRRRELPSSATLGSSPLSGLIIMNHETTRSVGDVGAVVRGVASNEEEEEEGEGGGEEPGSAAAVWVNGSMPCYVCGLKGPGATADVQGTGNSTCQVVSGPCDEQAAAHTLEEAGRQSSAATGSPLRVSPNGNGSTSTDPGELPGVTLLWRQLTAFCDPTLDQQGGGGCTAVKPQDLVDSLGDILPPGDYQLQVDSTTLSPIFQGLLADANSLMASDTPKRPPPGSPHCTDWATLNVYMTTTDAAQAQALRSSLDRISQDPSSLLRPLLARSGPGALCQLEVVEVTTLAYPPIERMPQFRFPLDGISPGIDLVLPGELTPPKDLIAGRSYDILLSNIPQGSLVRLQLNTLRAGVLVGSTVKKVWVSDDERDDDGLVRTSWTARGIAGAPPDSRYYMSASVTTKPSVFADTHAFRILRER